jgi:hypothetical protein
MNMKLDSMMTLTFLAVSASVALGCTLVDYHSPGDGTSSSTSGAGGSEEERGVCYTASSNSTGAGGGLVIPECTERNVTMLQGTIDGMPYQKTFHNSWFSGGELGPPPWTLDVYPPQGLINMQWSVHSSPSSAVPITGKVLIPGETSERELKPGSLLFNVCSTPWMFVLVVDGGELAGCTTT